MLLIVFGHNRSIFPTMKLDIITRYTNEGAFRYIPYVYEASIFGRLCFAVIGAVVVSLMPALLILSGYTVRKRSVSKCFSLEYKELLKPYLWATIATVVFNFIFHFCFFRYIPGALQESAKVLGGMVLGFSQNVQLGKITLFANGPIWFVLALFWALVIFNILLNMMDEEKIKYYALGLSFIGWLLSYVKYTPFCLSQGLIGVLYVYMGYYTRKSGILTSEHSDKLIVKYTLFVIIPNIILTFFGMLTEMADNVYSLGPVTYIENGLLGIGVLYVFLRINKTNNGKITNALRYLGRYSFYFMCIHTVEMIAFPWYLVAGKFVKYQLLGFVSVYIVRIILIFLMLKVLIRIIELYNRIKIRKTIG